MPRYSFQEFVDAIEQRLHCIKSQMDGFSKDIRDDGNTKRININYNGNTFFSLNYYISNYWTPDGKKVVSGMFTITAQNDSRWYFENEATPSINIDEYLRYNNYQQFNNLDELFDKYLPIRNEEKVESIKIEFKKIGLELEDIKFNTYDNRYWLYFDLSRFINNNEEEEPPTYLCKYVSLGTYMNMLKNRTFRLNSITSMNDTSESFFLGEFLCNVYQSKEERYKETVKNHNTFITSLSKLYDSALMWRLYGDCGKGICLVFDVKNAEAKPILYIGRKVPRYQQLRSAIQNLNKKGINIYIHDIESQRFYVKSGQFDYEEEYRLLHSSDDISLTQYEGLISYYKDLKIDEKGCIPELGIRIEEIIVGANLPQREVNYPLLVNLTYKNFGVSIVNWSEVDNLR
jgi:hypothetical protein